MDYEDYFFRSKFEVSFALEKGHNEERHTVCLCSPSVPIKEMRGILDQNPESKKVVSTHSVSQMR